MPEPGKRFVEPDDVETMMFDWGNIKWFSEPRVTETERFSMGLVILEPGKGHVRHNHPGVEEILYWKCYGLNGFHFLQERQYHEMLKIVQVQPFYSICFGNCNKQVGVVLLFF